MPPEDRMNVIDYVNTDRETETGETLTDDNILEMVSETRAADHVSDDNDEPEEPAHKKSDTRKGLAQAIGFCEQNPVLSAHLDNLWKAMRATETYSGACVQKTMLDFMKK